MNQADLEHEMEQLHPASFAWALGCCRRNRDDAEEILQIVYLKVLEGKAKFDGRSSLKTWLFSVIRNTAAARMRSIWMQPPLEFAMWFAGAREQAAVESADVSIEHSQRNAKLNDAVERLSSRQREVLQLVFYHDMTVEEAAMAMEVSVGSARVHYHRGKRQLLAMLNGDLR
ncbi:MAG TPA: RNA polymerase sigma factor [Thermoanaerobaculia bacterium]|nr:RNA polymerase sigma factor [Thermoanaerobaculia bacterium]